MDLRKERKPGWGRKWVIRILWGCAALVVAIPLLLLGLVLTTRTSVDRWEQRIDARWDDLLGPRREYPTMGPNETALELERIAAELGIDLAPPDVNGRAHPDPKRVEQREIGWDDAKAWLVNQLESPRGHLEPPPPAVRSLLAESEPALSQTVDLLNSGRRLQWRQDRSQGVRMPIPNLLGQLALHQLLVMSALVGHLDGQDRDADRAFEAAWQLARGAEDRSELVCQILYTSEVRTVLGALRKPHAVPNVWRQRIATLDERSLMANALRMEGWLARESLLNPEVREKALSSEDDLDLRLGLRLVSPYFRLSLLDYDGRLQDAVTRLTNESACTLDGAAFDQAFEDEMPRWNFLGRILAGPVGRPFARALALERDAELTGLVLRARAVRRRTGSWPPSLEGLESKACPESRWSYEIGDDGSMSIDLSQPPAPLGTGLKLPTRFQIDAQDRDMTPGDPEDR